MAPPAPAKRAPIEAKTQAAGVAGVVSGAVIWVLQTYVFKGTVNPGLVSLVYAAVPGVLAFGAAWLAPHTPRPVTLPAVPGYAQNVTLSVPPLSEAEAARLQQELAERAREGGKS